MRKMKLIRKELAKPEPTRVERHVFGKGEVLYDADPNCKHEVRAKEMHEGGGVECRKCKGWFCY